MKKTLCYWHSTKATWGIWGLLTLTIFVKMLIFHTSCFEDGFQKFFPFTNSLLYAMSVSCIALICKKKWPSIVLIALVDLWMIANVLYYRANGLFITVDAIKLIGGLKEFGGSLTAYTVPLMWVNSATGIAAMAAIYLIPWSNGRRSPETAILAILVTYLAAAVPDGMKSYRDDYKPYAETIKFYAGLDDYGPPFRQDHLYGQYGQRCFLPFNNVRIMALKHRELTAYEVQRNDIIWYAGAAIVYDMVSTSSNDVIMQPLSDEEWRPITEEASADSLRGDVIIILMESMESWPLMQSKEISHEIAPNLMRFIEEKSDHILYCTEIRSQVRHGVSGDGQMLVNTGMLPIRNGATCMLFAGNTWPTIAGHYEYSTLINPSKYAWNQWNITPAYGYKNEINQEEEMDDAEVFRLLLAVVDTIRSPFCVQAITMDTHTPFIEGRNSKLQLPTDMPKYMHDYIGCFNKSDSLLGSLLAKMESNEKLRNATIVITGDHTIFKEAYLRDFHSFAKKSGWHVPQKESASPLIIYSPEIKGKRIDTPLYQMDIYPTLKRLLGIRSETWKGFGIDIMEEGDREIDIDKAEHLSERIIRTNGYSNRIQQ